MIPTIWRSSARVLGALAVATLLVVVAVGRSSEAANSGFVSAGSGQFWLAGQPFRFASTNAYFLVDAATDGSFRHTDDMLALANALGFTVLRIWGFLDGPSAGAALQPTLGVYDEAAFRAMDQVLARADQAGVRLIVALVNYWSDYGGMPWYVQSCAPGQSVDAFYTEPACRQAYQSYVNHVLTRINTVTGVRYLDDPTILGWELANEPRSGDPTGGIVKQWVSDMSAYIKGIDPNHLVGVGEEGFDTTTVGYSPLSAYSNQGWLFDGTVGVSFSDNTALPTIDFASIHLYPEAWNLPPAAGSTWISDHIQIARNLGKPLILGEFGYTGSPWAVFDPWLKAFEAGQGAGAAIWEMVCSTVCGNYGGSLATAYPPSSVVAAGMARAAALAAGDAPPQDFTVTSTSASPSPLRRGKTLTVQTSIRNLQAAPAPPQSVHVELQILNSAGMRVAQTVCTLTIAAGDTRSCTWSYRPRGNTSAGSYSVSIGVLSADVSTLHLWVNQATGFVMQ